jgi:hypothetical protein
VSRRHDEEFELSQRASNRPRRAWLLAALGAGLGLGILDASAAEPGKVVWEFDTGG